jgi:UDP-N-acetylenolpyruvoylglucosamine reductase
MTTRHLVAAAATAAAAALLVPGTAGAVIVPQHGMGGVRVGDTFAKVRSVAGAPVRIVRGRVSEFGPYTEYRYRGFTVRFQGNRRVTSISTRATLQRTRSGVGVGTTEARLRRAIPAVRCQSFQGFRYCVLGVEEPGRRVTNFSITRGKVSAIVIGIVID